MKTSIESKYKELLDKFNAKHLQKIIKYFDRQHILHKFSQTLLQTYNKQIDLEKNESLQKASRFPLINQRLIKTGEAANAEIVKWIIEEYNIKESEIPNYEQAVIADFKLTEQEVETLFSFHYAYSLVALVYSEPFSDLENYELFKKFFYFLIMYINLELSFNKFLVNENYEPFLVKLFVQIEMIKILSQIDKQNYNDLIRQLNKWFMNKALYRVIKEIEKDKEKQEETN